MSSAIVIVAIIGVALIINHVLGGLGKGLVWLFEKIGLGKVWAYIFGACIFIVIINILRNAFAFYIM